MLGETKLQILPEFGATIPVMRPHISRNGTVKAFDSWNDAVFDTDEFYSFR